MKKTLTLALSCFLGAASGASATAMDPQGLPATCVSSRDANKQNKGYRYFSPSLQVMEGNRLRLEIFAEFLKCGMSPEGRIGWHPADPAEGMEFLAWYWRLFSEEKFAAPFAASDLGQHLFHSELEINLNRILTEREMAAVRQGREVRKELSLYAGHGEEESDGSSALRSLGFYQLSFSIRSDKARITGFTFRN